MAGDAPATDAGGQVTGDGDYGAVRSGRFSLMMAEAAARDLERIRRGDDDARSTAGSGEPLRPSDGGPDARTAASSTDGSSEHLASASESFEPPAPEEPYTEPRCVGHYVFSGYSHHGLAKNCHHAECRALAAAHAASGDGGAA